jgi:hypothetical protein
MAVPDGPAGPATAKRPPYLGAAAGLEDLWTAAYSSMETLLETVTLADVIRGDVDSGGRFGHSSQGALQ